MTNMLLVIIIIELALIWLSLNRVGDWIGAKINRLVYRWRTRKL